MAPVHPDRGSSALAFETLGGEAPTLQDERKGSLIKAFASLRGRLVVRLTVGLALTYGDLVSDVLVSISYHESKSTYFAASVVFLVVPILAQTLITTFFYQQGVGDVAASVLGLKPILDSYRVWTGADATASHSFRWSPESMLAWTKLVEATFESFPQGTLQLMYLLTTPTEAWSALNFVSISLSLGAISYTLTIGSIDVDNDSDQRRAAPWLHGWSGNIRSASASSRQRIALSGGMFFSFLGYIGALLLGFAAAAVTDFAALSLVLLGFFGLYLSAKIIEREFILFTMPQHLWTRPLRYFVSVFYHLAMFLFVFAAPMPLVRVPGAVNPHVWAVAIVGNLLVVSPTCIVTAYLVQPSNCDTAGLNASSFFECLSVDPAPMFTLWGSFTIASLLGASIFWSCGMVKSFRGSFYKRKTFRRQMVEYFSSTVHSGDLLETLRQELTARDPSYWPDNLPSTTLFQLAFPVWPPEKMPEWMTEEWKQQLPRNRRLELGFAADS